jgi:uncharacterized protein YndB with AHSA1/START domain
MIRVEIDTTIKHPVEEVFERLANINEYSTWMPKSGIFIKSEQTSAGPLGKGTTYYDQGRMGTFQGEVSDFERPTKVAYRETLRWLGMRVMEARAVYQLKAIDGGTMVHHVAEGQLYGIFKLMQPMTVVIARGERNRTVNALKKSLESSPQMK